MRFVQAMPAQSAYPGVSAIVSRFSSTCSQSSSRPTMIVQTGDMPATGRPSAARRLGPRSIASPTAAPAEPRN